MRICIREARKEDSPFIANTVINAIGAEESSAALDNSAYDIFNCLSSMERSQYSYTNALVAEIESSQGVELAGAIVGYYGGLLHELRSITYQVIKEYTGKSITIEDETDASEFYLDSLAVEPQYQGMGIGRSLLCALRQHAFDSGYQRVGLLVDMQKERAQHLYSSVGFVRVDVKNFLGHDMWHMQSTPSTTIDSTFATAKIES